MIYLKKSNIKKGDYTMVTRRTYDTSMYTEEEKSEMAKTGVFVENLPTLEVPDNHTYMLYVDEDDNPVYLYEDIPPSENEEIEQLKADLNEAVMELSMLIAMGGVE